MGGIWEMIMELGLQVTGNMWDDPMGPSSPDPTDLGGAGP